MIRTAIAGNYSTVIITTIVIVVIRYILITLLRASIAVIRTLIAIIITILIIGSSRVKPIVGYLLVGIP